MSKGNTWQHRKGPDDERFGLLDPAKSLKYRKTPVFEEPAGELERRPLTAMGLTCGVGSMLVGARELGFQVVGNVEWRDYYRYVPNDLASTFAHNFPGGFVARGTRDIPTALLPGEIDFAAGHPECGRYSTLSYSVAGGTYQESRGEDVSDIPMFLKLVALFRPKFFLMDDLPKAFLPFPMEKYIELLPDYDLFPEWISNWGYGNIQKHRNRMFIVGSRKDQKFVFRPGEALHTLVLKDIIPDLIDFGEKELIKNHSQVVPEYRPGRYVNMNFYGHRPSWEELQKSNQTLESNIPYFTPEGGEKIRPGTRSPAWDGWCPVLSGGFNPIHPLRRSPISVRERARIQGFPDSFIFHSDDEGPDREIWEPYNSDGQRGIKQTGKAMPLQFCTFVAKQVKAHLDKEPFTATDTRLLKPNDGVSQAKLDFCEQSGYADQDRACKSCWLTSTCRIYKASQNNL